MHELSVAGAILGTVRRNAGGRRVTLVSLRVGHLRQVVPDSLQFYWGIVTKGTVCEQARLQLEQVETQLACSDCGERWKPELPLFRCTRCGSANVQVSSGEELLVDYIEVEEQEAACTGPG